MYNSANCLKYLVGTSALGPTVFRMFLRGTVNQYLWCLEWLSNAQSIVLASNAWHLAWKLTRASPPFSWCRVDWGRSSQPDQGTDSDSHFSPTHHTLSDLVVIAVPHTMPWTGWMCGWCVPCHSLSIFYLQISNPSLHCWPDGIQYSTPCVPDGSGHVRAEHDSQDSQAILRLFPWYCPLSPSMPPSKSHDLGLLGSTDHCDTQLLKFLEGIIVGKKTSNRNEIWTLIWIQRPQG